MTAAETSGGSGGSEQSGSSGGIPEDLIATLKSLANQFTDKGLIAAIKEMKPSTLSISATSGLIIAAAGVLGIEIFNFKTFVKSLLTSANLEIRTTSRGISYPAKKREEPAALPTVAADGVTRSNTAHLQLADRLKTDEARSAVLKIETATQRLGTAIDGLHTKVDGLLAEFA
ncbi:hypothetical protein G3I76_44345 [Streptomyces sp. SID11233]|nr:hypothetical protein [Streptomyces sp. SID11233]